MTSNRTKMGTQFDIPLAPQVLKWLREVQIFAEGSEYLFPARRRVRMKMPGAGSGWRIRPRNRRLALLLMALTLARGC